MKLIVDLDLDNDAFIIEVEGKAGQPLNFDQHKIPNEQVLSIPEVRQCFDQVISGIDQVISGIGKTTSGKIMDSNGNSVGNWKVVR